MCIYLIYTEGIDFPTGWVIVLAILVGLDVVLGCRCPYKRNREARTRQSPSLEFLLR